jgi:putative aminopeptidase FrvX
MYTAYRFKPTDFSGGHNLNKHASLEMIAALSNANGAPGFEDEVIGLLRGYAADLGTVTEDAIRNLYVQRKENTGGRPVIQLDAHTDEVGLMVHAIKPNGTLMFTPLGSWVSYCLPAHKVRVRTKDGGYVPGVIVSKPVHFLKESERNAAPLIDNMVIDIGATSRREAMEDFGIAIGAPVVPDTAFAYDNIHDLLHGKAFDCRLGCAALVETMRRLAGNESISADIVAAFSSQEEVGCRGAQVAVATVKPDIAIVFEGCPADDTFSEDYMIQAGIKRGPMLRHIDAKMITNPRFQRFALDVAREQGIPVQEGVRTGGATNGSAIHLHSPAVPVIVIGFPVRYIHTHNCIASYGDFENGVRLAVAVIEKLNAEVIKGF